MVWSKLNKSGEVTSKISDKPKEGVWIARVDVPFTDQQGTLQYYAIDGTVMFPSFCVNGHERSKAFQSAKYEATHYKKG